MKNLEAKWSKNRDRLDGLVLQIQAALKDVEGLPDDLDCPDTEEEIESINPYASRLYDLFCEGAGYAEAMMVQEEAEKRYEDIQDEKGNTRDWYSETAHTRADF